MRLVAITLASLDVRVRSLLQAKDEPGYVHDENDHDRQHDRQSLPRARDDFDALRLQLLGALLDGIAPGALSTRRALTWMDARAEDWIVTPRRGKPVEIQALWYNALCLLASWLREMDDNAAKRYDDFAARGLDREVVQHLHL